MGVSPRWKIEWIDSSEALVRLLPRLEREEILSVDTETVGWDTGNERLCLIQIGIPSSKTVAIVDPLKIKDLSPLAPILTGKTPLLVAHNAPFEEKQFARHGMKLRGVVDTLPLARELRPDLPNHTLKTCCRYLLDVEISKEEQTSDWSKRPLTKEQIDYAALDAEVTVALHSVLAEMQSKLELDAGLKVSELMKLMNETVKARFQLSKEIASELALLAARENIIKEAIRAKLVDGEPAYEGQFGSAKVTKIKRTEIAPQLVRSMLPQIAALAISEYVERKRLIELMKEHNIEESMLDRVTEIVGYTDRMSLSLKDF